MSISPILPEDSQTTGPEPKPARKIRRTAPEPLTLHTSTRLLDGSGAQHHAELFYLQKQIQTQTPMVVVLANGHTVEGVIEWYDRDAIKLRGRSRTLIYKRAIKYMYKHGD